MVRTQNLSLNPSKVSGTCGRLMCCLAYESEFYQQACRLYPEPGQRVLLMGSPFEVVGSDIFHETVTVRGEGSQEPETMTLEEFQDRKKMEQPAPPPKPAARPVPAEKEAEAQEVVRKRRRRRRKPAGAEKERTR
jgi:hypothetical protein